MGEHERDRKPDRGRGDGDMKLFVTTIDVYTSN